MRKKGSSKGIVSIAFAAGLLVSCLCPPEFLVAALAIALILLGASCMRCR